MPVVLVVFQRPPARKGNKARIWLNNRIDLLVESNVPINHCRIANAIWAAGDADD
ncbi:MAG: hypothetical protein KDB22_06040 [Planctomycetales bacterium]|nr:hypothetical protein [Planctomycetales bacterium]